ncbi:hypothetical protein EB796_020861 [Bugula neritina]|uniref:Uncharacterized protein n=1 Tax=Bugula neritina TaxID=10212 RepID=A0A7J7J526_BUGNE|nr:hypothetical protein EB796_020861 [Bugula neritina]
MAEYQIPGNNQPIRGQINRACKHGSEASGSDSYAAFTAQRAEPPTPAPRSNSAVDVNENERASGASLSVSATISTNQEQDEEDEDMF